MAGAQSSPDQNNKKSAAIAVPLALVIVALVVLLLFLAYRYRRYQRFTLNSPVYNMSALEHSGTSKAAPSPTAVENPMYGSAAVVFQEGDDDKGDDVNKGKTSYARFE